MIQLLTIDETAKLLGVSKGTVRREIEDGFLKSVHVRSSLRISHEEIMNYLHSPDRKIKR